jgi:hypothetical protein
MRSRILGLGEEDTFLVHNTRAIKLSKPSKATPNAITFLSTRSSGNYTLTSVFSSTGFTTVEWWDGTKETTSTSVISKTVTTSDLKYITIYPSTATGQPSGFFNNLVALNTANNHIAIDCSNLKSISSFTLTTGLSSTFKIHPKTSITQLLVTCASNCELIDLSDCPSIYFVANLQTSTKNVSFLLPNAGYVEIKKEYLNTPTPILVPNVANFIGGSIKFTQVLFTETNIDYSNSKLTFLEITQSNVTSVIVDNSLSLIDCILSSNSSLSTFRCKNCVFYGSYVVKKHKAIGGLNLSGCNLSASALNQVFEDLGTATASTGYIKVYGNPGALTCNTSIATAKNYIVFTQ